MPLADRARQHWTCLALSVVIKRLLVSRSSRMKAFAMMTSLRMTAVMATLACSVAEQSVTDTLPEHELPELTGDHRTYDPEPLLFVRQGVGSEDWTDGGFTPAGAPR